MVFVSGMTARAGDGVDGTDEYAQARTIFTKIRYLVEAAGGAIDDVVKLTVFLTDIRNNALVWQARREVFSGDFPTSTLVEVRALAAPEILVEIEAIAMIGSSRD
jgi:enamine deaminase RidA (YjgF/YER057c/UK114 family)